MANQFQSITSGLAELKNYYQGPMKDQLNEELPIMRGAEKVKEGWSGYQVVRPLRVRRNQGIGAVSDGGTLPAIGYQYTQQATISAKFNYLRAGVTGPMIKSSQSDKGSFVRSAAYELEMGFKDLKSDLNRQLSWDGTGTLALANATSVATSSLVIKGRETGAPALQFVDVGLTFDVVSGSTIVAQGITVNSITGGTPTGTTATLNLSAPVTVTVGDKIIRSGSLNNEVQGLLYSLDGGTTTIYGVDRSTYISYQGNSSDLSSGQLTLDAMQNIYNEANRRGGAKLAALYTDYTSQRYYQKLLTADKRYVNTMKGDGGFSDKDKTYLEFNGLSVLADKDCPTRMFFLDQDAIKLYVLSEMEFADETGSMYIAQVSADAFEMRVRYFANLFNEQPAACAVLKGYISP